MSETLLLELCHCIKSRVCLLEAITSVSIASGSQCLNDALHSLPLLLLMHDEVKILSVLLMYSTRWRLIFLQRSGMCPLALMLACVPLHKKEL